MNSQWLRRLVVFVVTLASPPLLMAAEPPRQVVGMSALPDPAQDAVKREATRIGGQIGELNRERRNGHVVYTANVLGTRSETVTVSGAGRVLSREQP